MRDEKDMARLGHLLTSKLVTRCGLSRRRVFHCAPSGASQRWNLLVPRRGIAEQERRHRHQLVVALAKSVDDLWQRGDCLAAVTTTVVEDHHRARTCVG